MTAILISAIVAIHASYWLFRDTRLDGSRCDLLAARLLSAIFRQPF